MTYVPAYPLESRPQAPVHNAAVANGVNLASGEFIYSASDLHVEGISGDISITRTYRSFNINELGGCGPMGYGWHLNQDKWVRRATSDDLVEYYDGSGLVHLFVLAGISGNDAYYEDLRGLFATMTRTESGGNYVFTIRSADHSTQLIFDVAGDQGRYYIHEITTPTGSIEYGYSGGLLTTITNSPSTVRLTYDANGLLDKVYLDDGTQNYRCNYNHDSLGNLTAARAHATASTFYVVNYDYLSSTDPWGMHLLEKIRLNDESSYILLKNTYSSTIDTETNPGTPPTTDHYTMCYRVTQQEFPYGTGSTQKSIVKYNYYDRVDQYNVGRTDYVKVTPGSNQEDIWRTYYFNNLGNPIRITLTDFVDENTSPSTIQMGYTYNDDCLAILAVNPDGSGTAFKYDNASRYYPFSGNQADRLVRRGNLIEERAKIVATASDNDNNDLVTQYSYYLTDDPKANHPMALSDPNYPDEALSGTFGDHVTYYQYDIYGNCVLLSRPAPTAGSSRVNTSFAYYGPNLLHTVESPSPAGGTTTTELIYSSNRLYQQITDSGGLNLTTTIDEYYPTGTVKKSHDHQGVYTEVERDFLDRIVSEAKTNGQIVYSTRGNGFDTYGFLASTWRTDANNIAVSREWYDYDWQGRITDRIVGQASLVNKNVAGQIVTLYGYDDNGNLTSTTDSEGRICTTLYNRRNLPVCSITAGQYTSKVTYDQNGQVVHQYGGHSTVSGLWATQTTICRDGFGREISRISGSPLASNYTIYGSSSTHDIVDVKETGRLNCAYTGSGSVPAGNLLDRSTYDVRDAWHRVTDAHNFAYSSPGNQSSANETKTEYLASGQVYKTTQCSAYTCNTITYDKVLQYTYDAIGRTKNYTSNGVIVGGSTTQSLNAVNTEYYDNVAYDGHQNCTAVFTKSTSYDPSNPSSTESNASIVVNNHLGQSEWVFNVPKTASAPAQPGQGGSIQIPTGSIMTQTTFNVRGLPTEVVTASGTGTSQKSQKVYDNAGHCIETVTLDSPTSTTGTAEYYFLNKNGQSIATLTADYDNGNLSNIKVNTVTIYDSAGRPCLVYHGVVPSNPLVFDPSNSQYYTQWSGAGFSSHNVQYTTYDGITGNPTTVRTFGDEYSYNLLTSLQQQYDETRYEYDSLNRVTEVWYWRVGDSTPMSRVESRNYDYLGMVSNVTTYDRTTGIAVSSVATTHAPNGNVTAETQTVAGSSPITVNSIYNNWGFCTSKSITGGTTLTWVPGPNNLPTSMNYGSETVATYGYTGGKLTSRVNENGTNLAVGYDLFGSVSVYYNKLGSTHIASFAYGYDEQHRRIYQQYLHDGNKYDVFTYNGRDFVTDVKYGATDQYGANYESSDSFAYDNAGNRTTATLAGVSYGYTGKDGSTTFSGGNANNEYYQIQIDSNDPIILNHNPRGNRVAYGSDTSGYDYANRMTNYKGATYVYDANNRRLQMTSGGVTTRFVWDGWQCRQERDSSGNVTREFIYGTGLDEILQMRQGTDVYTYHTDAQGNVVALTNSAGQVVETYRYDIYGRLRDVKELSDGVLVSIPDANENGYIDTDEYYGGSLTDNPYLFQSQRLDKETGLYYFRNRYYDPVHGRFLTRDPAEDGLNLYAFVNNNPINCVDPMGLYNESIHRDLTKWLAEKAGFDATDQETLGTKDQGVDEDPMKKPVKAWFTHMDHLPYEGAVSDLGQAQATLNLANSLPDTYVWDIVAKGIAQAEVWKEVKAAEAKCSLLKAAFDLDVSVYGLYTYEQAVEANWWHFARDNINETVKRNTAASSDRLANMLKGAIDGQNLADFGALLHTVQDSYSHEGGQWAHPNAFSKPLDFLDLAADDPKLKREKYMDMAKRTLELMLDYRRKSESGACVPNIEDLWKSVKGDVANKIS
jgi:RHS repeat-associated protein